jgi:hypothetical protein
MLFIFSHKKNTNIHITKFVVTVLINIPITGYIDNEQTLNNNGGAYQNECLLLF